MIAASARIVVQSVLLMLAPKHSVLTNSRCFSFSSISVTHRFNFTLLFSLFLYVNCMYNVSQKKTFDTTFFSETQCMYVCMQTIIIAQILHIGL